MDIQVTLAALNSALPGYGEAEPVFFESKVEVAVYLQAIMRPLYAIDAAGRSTTDGRVCLRKHVDVDLSAMTFTGIGAWWLRAVRNQGSEASWPDRQAPMECVPPAGAVFVLDIRVLWAVFVSK